jgi:hypothetical protein
MDSTLVSYARCAEGIPLASEPCSRAPGLEAESCVQEHQDAIQLRTTGDR